jgi:hypothetical protein
MMRARFGPVIATMAGSAEITNLLGTFLSEPALYAGLMPASLGVFDLKALRQETHNE